MKNLRFVEDFRRNATLRKWAIGVGLAGSVGVAVVFAVGPSTAPVGSTTAPTTRATSAPASPTAPTTTASARPTDNSNRNYGRDSSYGRGRNGRRDNNQSGVGSNVVNSNDPYSAPPTRSIFLKGNQELVSTRTEVRTAPPVNYSGFDHGKDTNLIFNGVTIVDDKPAAFVEDIQTNVVGIVKPGDAVAGGTVKSITFHDLEYTVNGQLKRIAIGQNFSGEVAVTASAGTVTAISATAPSSNGGVQIIGNGASIPTTPAVGGPSGMSTQDILARMKARKEQEAKQMSSH